MLRDNRDEAVVRDFGLEWSHFDQGGATEQELREQFESYFETFPWTSLPPEPVGFDLGCGSGRWDVFLAPRVGHVHCIEPSAAIDVARRRLQCFDNVSFHKAGVTDMPLTPASMDFGVSLGVLHHVPDTEAALRACADKLKPGAPLFLYLYYDFENRPWWFRGTWRATDLLRRGISRLPFFLKRRMTSIIAVSVYFPLARFARVAESLGMDDRLVDMIPLARYRNKSVYTMRTDSLDRFGTRLEKRFSRARIQEMMARAGLTDVTIKNGRPYWMVLGWRSPAS